MIRSVWKSSFTADSNSWDPCALQSTRWAGQQLDWASRDAFSYFSTKLIDVWLGMGQWSNQFLCITRFGKATVSKPLKFPVIQILWYAKFFLWVAKDGKYRTGLSCVQWRAHESHGPSPSGRCEQTVRVSCVYRGALMHGLQGAEAQGPTLAGINHYLYASLQQWEQHSVNKLTHSFSATPWL